MQHASFISALTQSGAIEAGARDVWILAGGRDSGKTTRLKQCITSPEAEGMRICGVYSEKALHAGEVAGYDLVELPACVRHPLIRTQPFVRGRQIGRFHFDEDGFDRLNESLRRQPIGDVAVLDEIGIAEMDHGAGLFPSLVFFTSLEITLVLAVRDSQVESVRTFLKHARTHRNNASLL